MKKPLEKKISCLSCRKCFVHNLKLYNDLIILILLINVITEMSNLQQNILKKNREPYLWAMCQLILKCQQ